MKHSERIGARFAEYNAGEWACILDWIFGTGADGSRADGRGEQVDCIMYHISLHPIRPKFASLNERRTIVRSRDSSVQSRFLLAS